MKTSLVLETLKQAEELRAYRSTLKIAPDKCDCQEAEGGGSLNPQQRAAIERLKTAGGKLANAAYNLSQRAGELLTATYADSLRSSQLEWDSARNELHAALEAPEPARTLAEPVTDAEVQAALLAGNPKMLTADAAFRKMMRDALEGFAAGRLARQVPAGVETAPVEPGWVNVADSLPDLDAPVFGLVRGAIAVYCRTFFSEGEGWLWSIQPIYWDLTQADGFECEDDYEVEFWRPMFELPKGTP